MSRFQALIGRLCLSVSIFLGVTLLNSNSVHCDQYPLIGGDYDPNQQNWSAWLGHTQGRQIGDIAPFTSFGATRYLLGSDVAWSLNSQGIMTWDGNGGGTLGINRRQLFGNTVLGTGFWYDANASRRDKVFQQIAYSLELLRDKWAFRTNGYLPVGPRNRYIGTAGNVITAGQPQFFQNYLVTATSTSTRIYEAAMKGIEVEIARSIGEWSGEAFIGYYNFNGEIGRRSEGLKGGVRGYITPRLLGNIAIADDPLFGSNVYGGFTWFYGGSGTRAPQVIEDKLTIPVERNNQVAVNEVQKQVISVNQPLTYLNMPIKITHINDSGIAGDGTYENPHGSLNDADADPNKAGNQIAYVYSGTTFNGQNYSLAPNQRLLGEGDNNQQWIMTDQLGWINLPAANGIGETRPTINNAPGQGAISLASNSEVSNFLIQDSVSAAIYAGGVSGVNNVNRTHTVRGARGADIIGGGGTFNFTDVTVTDPTIAGFHVNGGSSTINFGGANSPNNGQFGASSIQQNANGSAVNIRGGHSGSFDQHANSTINATNGDGLQFDDANGTYDFAGTVSLNGGDAGIDILSDSAGTFTFANTDITNPMGTGLNVDGGSANVTYSGGSISQSNIASAVNVQGGHSGTLNFGVDITATNGDGLQFNNANGIYNFNTMTGLTSLGGGDAGIDILGGSAGTFTFANTDITNPMGTGLNVDGGSANVTYSGGSIWQSNDASTVNVQGGHTGTLNFGVDITATNGDGLQFNNADGTYNFNLMTGSTTLNGGDAGIDILGGSAGTFTFSSSTTITNPTGGAVRIANFETGGTVNFDGSIQSDNDYIISIDTTAASSKINFNANGANSLTSTDNPFGGIFIFDADGDITITTPTTFTRPGFSSLFATDGDGTWTFNDMTIVDQTGLNGGIDVFGNMGTVNFHNLNVSTMSAGTGDGVTGFLAGGNNVINVTGNSNVWADGGAAIALININEVDITFNNVTSLNNLNSQIGFAGDDGIDLLNVGTGTFDVTGMTTVRNADGVGISIADTGATVTFANVHLDTIGRDGIISGVAFNNPGIININSGLVNNTGLDGARLGSNISGNGVLGGFNLNNVAFTNIGGNVIETANSTLSGSGNIAPIFSCNDLGGNTGYIDFNGGADRCP